KMVNCRATEIVEIMRENLGGQADGDAFCTFEQDDREFGGKRDRFLGATVVAQLPRGGFRVEEDVFRERREAGFNITRRGGLVTGEHVAIVTLRLNEEPPLADRHEGGTDRGVAVRVKTHRGTDDIRDFVETAVIHLPKRV